jgi:hypothetical protein
MAVSCEPVALLQACFFSGELFGKLMEIRNATEVFLAKGGAHVRVVDQSLDDLVAFAYEGEVAQRLPNPLGEQPLAKGCLALVQESEEARGRRGSMAARRLQVQGLNGRGVEA